jgi:hypothetical protein
MHLFSPLFLFLATRKLISIGSQAISMGMVFSKSIDKTLFPLPENGEGLGEGLLDNTLR